MLRHMCNVCMCVCSFVQVCVFKVNALRLISTQVYSIKEFKEFKLFNSLDLNQSHRT